MDTSQDFSWPCPSLSVCCSHGRTLCLPLEGKVPSILTCNQKKFYLHGTECMHLKKEIVSLSWIEHVHKQTEYIKFSESWPCLLNEVCKTLNSWKDNSFVFTEIISLHGSGFSCPIVPQEAGDLALIEVDWQPVDRHLLPRAVHLFQVSDRHTQFPVLWLRL